MRFCSLSVQLCAKLFAMQWPLIVDKLQHQALKIQQGLKVGPHWRIIRYNQKLIFRSPHRGIRKVFLPDISRYHRDHLRRIHIHQNRYNEQNNFFRSIFPNFKVKCSQAMF